MIKKFHDIKEWDNLFIGTKARNCAKFIQHGLQAVDGYVVYDQFTKEDRTVIDNLLKQDMPYAVRSSMSGEDGEICSQAGRYESIMGVEKEEVPGAIQEIMDQAKACEHKAVIIQPLLFSEASGVIFTKDPINNSFYMRINACLGAGDNVLRIRNA